MSAIQAELLAELAAGLVEQDAKEAQRLGALSLTAESIPPSFTRLLMALRRVDKVLSDELYRQAILAMRANGLRYDSTLMSLTNYEFFANGRPVPDAAPNEISIITQYFVDAAAAHLALLRSGPLSSDDQASLGYLYSFLNSRAVPVVELNSPNRLTLLQTNLAEIAQGLTSEQRQQAEMMSSFHGQRSSGADEGETDVDSQIRRAEQEKNIATRDALFLNLTHNVMWNEPEKALDIARKIDDLELRAQTEDAVYLVMLANEFRFGSTDNAKRVALKINDMAARARWLAEIAGAKFLRSRVKDNATATDLLSEASTIAAKSDNNPSKLDAQLFIAQHFLQFDRARGFEILSEALQTANRIDQKPQTSIKAATPGIHVISISMVNGKERSAGLKPTLESMDFNEVAEFAKTDYFQTTGLGDGLKDHLLRSKYFVAIARGILDVKREGPAYEPSFADFFPN